jgi:DNA-binding CsgD family transcriptional regulator/chorismate mutase
MLSTNINNYNDRERKVLELYDDGKSTRDIAKEMRMSLRDISIILRKNQLSHGNIITKDNGNDNKNSTNKSHNVKATQAYKLFSEGKKPFEVAIELGIREAQVNKFFREFWKLKRLNLLYEIYPQIRYYLPSFLKLHKALKRKGLTADNIEWFANAMETSVIKLPELQGQRQSLQKEILDKQRQRQELQRALQIINKRIVELADVEKMHHHNIDTLQNDIHSLFNERRQLQQFVSKFKNIDSRYLQIRSIAEEVVDRLLAERKSLLSSALVAVVEALRMNPDRYAVIYDSKYDDNCSIFDSDSNIATAASSSPSTTTKPQNHNHYYNEYREGILEIANSLLKILTNQIVDKTMVAALVQEK